MGAVFFKVFEMSIAASFMIVVVIVIRLLLKKSPRWVICLLWALVAIKLICPFHLSIPVNILDDEICEVYTQVQGSVADWTTDVISGSNYDLQAEEREADRSGSFNGSQKGGLSVFAAVWICGMLVMAAKGLHGYIKLRRTVSSATIICGNVVFCEGLGSPFIFGLAHPKIIVPCGTDDSTLMNVLKHEKAHIERGDQWWKFISFSVRVLHWFNPFVWIGCALFSGDVEMACDERVIRDMERGEIAGYLQSLLSFSINKRSTAGAVAFGGNAIKARIKRVLNYKKPGSCITALSLVICLIVGACFMTMPVFGKDSVSERAVTGKGWTWPCDSRTVTFPYGRFVYPVLNQYGFSDHMCISADAGDNVYAANDGEVVFSGYDESNGNYVIIRHHSADLNNDISTVYRHLDSAAVKTNDLVKAGQTIGFAGSTGKDAAGPHLAFCVLKNGETIDPMELYDLSLTGQDTE